MVSIWSDSATSRLLSGADGKLHANAACHQMCLLIWSDSLGQVGCCWALKLMGICMLAMHNGKVGDSCSSAVVLADVVVEME